MTQMNHRKPRATIHTETRTEPPIPLPIPGRRSEGKGSNRLTGKKVTWNRSCEEMQV
jgi:hypothetical protein